jgi:hypothetical protein
MSRRQLRADSSVRSSSRIDLVVREPVRGYSGGTVVDSQAESDGNTEAGRAEGWLPGRSAEILTAI